MSQEDRKQVEYAVELKLAAVLRVRAGESVRAVPLFRHLRRAPFVFDNQHARASPSVVRILKNQREILTKTPLFSKRSFGGVILFP
jgi:hypothetical protein